ncbi:MAG: nitrous oxide reductase accessory protein NosL [Ignavibacteriaceae bacterium]|jgi:copper chaperone NosL|nr:nitrous oxide reductase accessory protein NosL [Ignavibacteriaceae bacterium]
MQNKIQYYLLAFVIILFVGCSKEPKPINYGEEECEFCKMLVMDKRYGSEIVTDKGKVYFFDSIECLVGYIENQKLTKDNYHSLWVSNYSDPGNIIDAEKAVYLKNDSLRSPMGLNVLAVENEAQLGPILQEFGGTQLKFEDLFDLVREM